MAGERIKFRYEVVTIKHFILNEDLIAAILRIEFNHSLKDTFIIDRCSIKGWDCNIDLIELRSSSYLRLDAITASAVSEDNSSLTAAAAAASSSSASIRLLSDGIDGGQKSILTQGVSGPWI